jgi:hypothetical protein
MKRIAMLLAAVGFGTGCVYESTTCATRTLSVDWAFVDATGVGNLPCNDAVAGADWVDIWFDGTFQARLACTYYAAVLEGVPSGPHEVVIEGILGGTASGGGTIVTRDWVSALSIDSCGDTAFHASPGEAELSIDYTLPGGSCLGGTYMEYSLTDEIAGTSTGIGATNSCALQRSKACGSPLVFTLPYGRYTADFVDEATVAEAPATVCTGTAVSWTCSPATADLLAPTNGTPVSLPVTLVDTTCP